MAGVLLWERWRLQDVSMDVQVRSRMNDVGREEQSGVQFPAFLPMSVRATIWLWAAPGGFRFGSC
jgi:hypothetical protein